MLSVIVCIDCMYVHHIQLYTVYALYTVFAYIVQGHLKALSTGGRRLKGSCVES